MEREFSYKVDDQQLTLKVRGQTGFGAAEVLLQKDDNLLANTPWNEAGYVVKPFLEAQSYAALVEGIQKMVRSLLAEVGCIDLDGFTLERYHRYAAEQPHFHAEVVKRFQKCFDVSLFPIDPKVVVGRIGEILDVPLTAKNPHIPNSEVFCIRIVRPQSNDNNPPHRDVWLDRLRSAVNIYAPLAGSNALSSLPLLPGSHLWPEAEIERTLQGAEIGGLNYSVPSVTGAKRNLTLIRPAVEPNEVMIFSPYLIHGGAANLNQDMTRVSLEMRFWRKK